MRVLGGPEVALDESVFLVGMYKYKDKPFFYPPLPSAARHRPSSPFFIGEGKRGKSKLSPNCDQTHIHQLLDLLCYYRIL